MPTTHDPHADIRADLEAAGHPVPTGGPIPLPNENPADPEAFIRAAIYWYPQLFANRTQVLQHLFCSPGNGCHWNAAGGLETMSHPLEKSGDVEWRQHIEDAEQRLAKHKQDLTERGGPDAVDAQGPDSMLALLQSQLEAATAASDEYARRRREVYTVAATHGPVHDSVVNPHRLRVCGMDDRPARRMKAAWAAVLAETRVELARVAVAQEKAVATVESALEARGAAAAAELLHPVVARAYVGDALTADEYTAARALLEQHAPAAEARELLDEEHESGAVIRQAVRALWGETLKAPDDAPDDTPRSAVDAIAAAEADAYRSVYMRVPELPSTDGAAEGWVHRRWRDLIAP